MVPIWGHAECVTVIGLLSVGCIIFKISEILQMVKKTKI